jgi:hypothetical protein
MNQADLAGLLQTIAQQQTALLQQQTALLQVHGETVRLQRLLVEHILGNQAGAAAAIPAPVTEYSQLLQPSTGDVPSPSPATPTPVATETPPPLPPPATSSPTPVAAEPLAHAALPAAPAVLQPTATAPRAARYYQPTSVAPSASPAWQQDLELMRRLREIGDASSLILQFGPHKGATLAEVAMHDPDYVRGLVNRAQRPEVREAAGRLVSALEAAADHKPRAARGANRKSSAKRSGPRG